MPTNRTENYNLCQWEPEDKVIRTDFNEDNAKIDAAIKAVDRRVDGMASMTALDGLASTVAGLSGALEKKGNCILYSTSYTGTGTFGTDNPSKHTFPGKPMFVVIGYDQHIMFALHEQSLGLYFRNGTCYPISLSWSGNTMEWAATSDMAQLNMLYREYNMIALLAADA